MNKWYLSSAWCIFWKTADPSSSVSWFMYKFNAYFMLWTQDISAKLGPTCTIDRKWHHTWFHHICQILLFILQSHHIARYFTILYSSQQNVNRVKQAVATVELWLKKHKQLWHLILVRLCKMLLTRTQTYI